MSGKRRGLVWRVCACISPYERGRCCGGGVDMQYPSTGTQRLLGDVVSAADV